MMSRVTLVKYVIYFMPIYLLCNTLVLRICLLKLEQLFGVFFGDHTKGKESSSCGLGGALLVVRDGGLGI